MGQQEMHLHCLATIIVNENLYVTSAILLTL